LRRAEKASTGKSGAGAVSEFGLFVGFANFAIALRAKFLNAKYAKDSQRAAKDKVEFGGQLELFSKNPPLLRSLKTKDLESDLRQVFEK
jgi:hypothetical protein